MPAMSSAPIGETSTRAQAATASASSSTVASTEKGSRRFISDGSGGDSPGPLARIAETRSSGRRVRRLADARAHELADAGDRLLGLVQHRIEPVPDVDHRGPLLDLDVDAPRARSGAEAQRIVEEHLVAAQLGEERREVSQIGVEWRGEAAI